MKKLLIALVTISAFISCKNDPKTEVESETEKVITDDSGRTAKQNDGLTLLKGEFVYFGDAAVLQTHRDVYAVVIDDKMHELNDLSKKYKVDETDYATVTIRGKITPKPAGEEGWPFRVTIKEIIKVSQSDPESNNVVKLESK